MTPLPLWVKICGNTSLADARLAVDSGADAVGFVFAPSPRRVTAAEAAGIISQLPAAIEKIGVFVDAGLDEIESIVRACGLTGVQLHFNAAAELTLELRERFGPALRILRVVHFEARAGREIEAELSKYAGRPDIDAVMVDSRTANAVGGTGVAFDWAEARKMLFSNSGSLKLIAAGGLNPANVAEAIATLRPWGVDVVSGVEAAPGRKDPKKVREFVARARVGLSE